MKRIITILILLFYCFIAKAQSNGDPVGFPTVNSAPYYKYNGYLQVADNKGFLNSISDTNWHPRFKGTQIYKESDSSLYIWSGNIWIKAGSGSGGSGTFFGLSDVDSAGIQDGYTPYYQASSGNVLFQAPGTVSTGSVYYAIDSTNTPPVSPNTNDVYMVGGAGTGAWSGHNYDIATYNGASWDFTDPTTGDIAVVTSTKKTYKYNGSTWVITGGIPLLIGGNNLTSGLQFGTLTNVANTWIVNGLQRIRVSGSDIIFNRGANAYTFPSTNSAGVLTNNGTGTLTWAAVSGFVTSVGATSPITSSGGTTPTISTSMATNKLIGRYSAGTGTMQEITISTGLSLDGSGNLTATGGSGTVTSVDLGYGITGSSDPITSTGSVIADTLYLQTKLGWLDAVSWGADTTGTVDATAVIQKMLNAAVASGKTSVTLYFRNGTYKIAGALQTTDGTNNVNSAQIYIPYATWSAVSKMHIRILGESPVNQYTSRKQTVPVTKGVRFLSTMSDAAGGCVFGAAYNTDADNPLGFNFNETTFENVIVTVRSKTGGGVDTVPTITAINAGRLAMFNITNCVLNTESAMASSSAPATTANGLVCPANGNWARVHLTDVAIYNFNSGIVASEHCVGTNVYVATCTNGIELVTGAHNVFFDRPLIQWCVNNVKITGTCYFKMDYLDIEEYVTAGGDPSKWYNNSLDIYEPSTVNALGSITYQRTRSNIGVQNSTFNVSATLSTTVKYTQVDQPTIEIGTNVKPNTTNLFYVLGSDGKVASAPTLATKVFSTIENNGNALQAFITSTTGQSGLQMYKSGTANSMGGILYDMSTNAMTMYTNNATGAPQFTIASTGFTTLTNGLSVGTNKLYVDFTNSRVGFGTASPASEFEMLQDPSSSTRGFTMTGFSASTTNALLAYFKKARGTSGTPTALVSGDNIGLFRTQGYDGSAYQQSAYFGFLVDNTVSSGVVPTAFVIGTGTASFGTERWRVESSLGNLSNTGAAGTAYITLKAGTATASTAPLKFTTGTVNTTAEAGAFEYTTPRLFFTNGGGQRQELFQGQQSRVSTQFDKTDQTLANITGLTATLVAGKIYRFEAKLYTTSDVAGGIKVAIAGTATATAIVYEGLTTDAGLTTQSRATALATAVGAVTAVTNAYVVITGTITCNAAGTLTVQSARNAASGTTSILVGSTFVVTEMN